MRKKAVALAMRMKRDAMEAKGLNLLKVLQSEITHELSSPCFQNNPSGSPGDFTLEWDAPHSQDVVLRKKCDTGEEVVVSAVLGLPYTYREEATYPRLVKMKVCIKKPGLSSLLHFDCKVFSYDDLELRINSAQYLPSTSSTGRRFYTGPPFFEFDPEIQAAFKEYLEARGIGPTLLHFLQQHMHAKEETQYVNWLKKLQETVS
ncbi:hypothetical protein RND81_12G007000 [Saponaria officinalis]|uniref:Mitochondrial glycoprotein n=1 Tax=Saponaria officinalis TaxID=3572 RepID=A0AAW1H495_SAPOF